MTWRVSPEARFEGRSIIWIVRESPGQGDSGKDWSWNMGSQGWSGSGL